MSFKQWLVLLGIYILFMLLGAIVFIHLEVGHELSQREDLMALKTHVTEVLWSLDNSSRGEVEELLKAVGEECGNDFLQQVIDDPLTWSLWNSFFFTFTVITTIGFGHMYPATAWGRVFCILYTFIGVPFNGIVVAYLADLFSSKVVNSQVRKYAKRYHSWVGVATDTVLYLVPGMVIFLLVPSAVLTHVEEDWDFLDAFYFSVITLTTIGFGDRVAGLQEKEQVWLWVYKIVMVVWIFMGVGYIIMIITFIQKALRSKQVHEVEKKLALALKRKTNKLNTNVQRDLKRIRTAMITIAMTGVHPWYPDEETEKSRPAESIHSVHSRHSLHSRTNVTPLATPSVYRTITSQSMTITRSASDSQLDTLCKVNVPGPQPTTQSKVTSIKLARVDGLESLNHINNLLDIVQTMVEEHSATAAEDMEDEMRKIVEVHQYLPGDVVNSFGASGGPGSAQEMPRAMEAGFLNQAYIDEDAKVRGKCESSDTPYNHYHTLHDRIQTKLNLLFPGKYPRKSSLLESIHNSEHFNENDGGVWVTTTEPPSTSWLEDLRQTNQTVPVPGFRKPNAEKTRPHLRSLFMNPKTTRGGVCKSPEHTYTSNDPKPDWNEEHRS